ncbi:MAG TPA: hypothetical protein VL988_01500 [Solirubrobacteraceae bacterium]|nr:hypothetical protein [Solirubrobacteraceae bacterium]
MARLFALTVLVYPLVLALLCLGAGLAVDRGSGGFLAGALLPVVGLAALVALSQLSTLIVPLAPATPYLMLALGLAGLALGLAPGSRARALWARVRARPWAPLVALAAYLLALAPVLLAGRASFSSFMALSDSAVHMIGADYLIHHGQSYGGLDLRSSYGQFIKDYYGTGYPSGADTAFGGSALLLGLPLIWAFQPFCALLLALASGPALVLARRLGLRGGFAALAALAAPVSAIVYAYELIGSVKELLAVAMLLALGALLALHRRWLGRAPRAVVPCALVLAAGVSALGVGFGAWALAAGVVLLAVLAGRRDLGPRATAAGVLLGAAVLLVAAWPTWRHVSQSLHVAQAIASTANPGNLQTPLRWTQAFGVWLNDSYKERPTGPAGVATYALVGVTLAACLLGACSLLRRRGFALAGWIALTLLAWLVLSRTATTWVDAKALVLTSPVLVLLAWGGVAALSRGRGRGLAAGLLALALLGGAVASDLIQYHGSNLAPTARYEELGSIGKRFRGRGPALFTDFDEYSLYQLRDLDLGGPDFVYPPRPVGGGLAVGYGEPDELDRHLPAALSGYRLIVTRRDPGAATPPAAYRLAWRGDYYEVWARRADARPALVHVPADEAKRPLPCARVLRTVGLARSHGAVAVAALAPELVRVRLHRGHRPAGWGRERGGFAMHGAGAISLGFRLPHAGGWELWLQGQFMPRIDVSVDGRHRATVSGQLAGNSLVPDTAKPLLLSLGAGAHTLRIARAGFSLAPGNGGSAVLAAAFLTPAGTPARRLRALGPGASSCARPIEWIELVPNSEIGHDLFK